MEEWSEQTEVQRDDAQQHHRRQQDGSHRGSTRGQVQEPIQVEAGSGAGFTALLVAAVFVWGVARPCMSAPSTAACCPGGLILNPGDLAKCPL